MSADKPEHTGTSASAEAPSVAIIDCDAKMRNDLVHLLESQNISPIPFSSSAEFLSATLHGTMVEPNIKLVLCRFELEQGRGLELLQRLRDENFKTPCLVYSSHGDVSTAVNSLRTGALDFIDNARPDMCFCERVLRLLSKHSPEATAQLSTDNPAASAGMTLRATDKDSKNPPTR